MASGLLGSLLGNTGLIQKGAEMMGFTMPSWATGAIDIAAETFGSKGGGGGGGTSSSQRYSRAVDLGGTVGVGEKLVGPGEQKSSAAVEYEDELRNIEAAIRLYAKAE
jgi:hypothetical protein